MTRLDTGEAVLAVALGVVSVLGIGWIMCELAIGVALVVAIASLGLGVWLDARRRL